MAKRRKKTKSRLKTKNILIFFLFLFIIINIAIYLLKLPIKNIYIYNNKLLTDQQIIEQAKIENYPSFLKNFSLVIESRLKKNIYIKSVKVKNKFREVHIEIEENQPLFMKKNKLILANGVETKPEHPAPTLINVIPDTIYNKFRLKMAETDQNIITKISEIEYKPDDVENERFLFYMNDGNLVYITLNKMNKLNNYLDIIKNFNNQLGILYLDYGNHFKLID